MPAQRKEPSKVRWTRFARWTRWLRRRLRPPRSLKVTREGRWYLGLTLGVGFAAVNTGNNLLFLSLGVLLALIILSGLLSEAALKKLSVKRSPPRELRAGELTQVELLLHNGNRLLPSIGLELEELPVEGLVSAASQVFALPAAASQGLKLRLQPSRRGLLRLRGVRVTTRYPFGIFAKSREFEAELELVVWPGRGRACLQSAGRARASALQHRPRPGAGDDLHGLRPWREGDETRRVHWRRSFALGSLLVVEREALSGQRVRLRLEAGQGAAFERAIQDTAASLEAHLEAGDVVSLKAPGIQLGFGEGRAHRQRLLTALALLPGAPETVRKPS